MRKWDGVPYFEETLGDIELPAKPKLFKAWSQFKKLNFMKDPCEKCLVEPTCSEQCEDFKRYNYKLNAKVYFHLLFLNSIQKIKDSIIRNGPELFLSICFIIIIAFTYFIFWLCKQM